MKNLQKIIAYSVCIFIGFNFSSCTIEEKKQVETIKASEEALVMKGEYLVNIMGCHDCHSPKKIGPMGPEIIPELMLSGYPQDKPVPEFDWKLVSTGISMMNPDLTAAAGPWGISFAGNLTPHATGLGNWTEVQFRKAITEGKYKGMDGTRMLLPPMPWMNYKDLKDEDVKAIFAYLRSVKPVKNIVPQPMAPLAL